ncbi:MAG TPA: hypothetical protein VHC49_22255 [Mycobacteriales bacterium]|nr:hypothetical protein [Mycobacteriales bacterium]
MVQPARQTLLIVWDDDAGGGSEMAPGITVYGIAATGTYLDRPFPVDIWPDGTRVKPLHFSGAAWQMPAWNIAVSSWPRGQEWTDVLRRTLAHLISGGCVVAWMGTEFEMCSPPDLFSPDCMGGVSAALTDDGQFICTVDPDAPLADLDDQEMLRLRSYAGGLADVD